jgi:hypothetical protein
MSGLRDIKGQLEALRLGRPRDVKKFEARGHVIIKRCLLLERALSLLRDHGHGQLLLTHMPYGAFYVNQWWWAEEALLAAVRLLGDGRMQTHDGGHGHHASRVLRNVVLHDASNLRVRVVAAV